MVELYADWCGPCKAVVPATKRMSEQEDAARLHFAQASCFLVLALCAVRRPPAHTSSLSPALQMCAERCEVLPSAKEHRGKSEPLFMLYQVSQQPQHVLSGRSWFRHKLGQQ